MKKLIEKLASIQHDIWAHWMKYLFSTGKKDEKGNYVIPKEKVDRWERQMNTPYKDLSRKEQESDIEQVNKFKHLISK